MKLISDCLNFIDSIILCSIEKHGGIGNLEGVRDYMVGCILINTLKRW